MMGMCSSARCRQPASVTYLGAPLCDLHFSKEADKKEQEWLDARARCDYLTMIPDCDCAICHQDVQGHTAPSEIYSDDLESHSVRR